MDINEPQTTESHRDIIRRKTFLKLIYDNWYKMMVEMLPAEPGCVFEVGSGAGFLAEYVPHLITSEVVMCRDVDMVADAAFLPFKDSSLRAVVMVDVLHHLANPRLFLREAYRCLKPMGSIVMIEPWVTAWSRFVWAYLHHEPFNPDSPVWELPVKGRLSGANSALPWIIFERDRRKFEIEFPDLEVTVVKKIMPFCYLLSGGMTRYCFQPGWSFEWWLRLEKKMEPWMGKLAMFAVICLVRETGNE